MIDTNTDYETDSLKDEKESGIGSILLVVFVALLIRIFVVELFYVPTGSMKSTILEGDYIFSTKYSYGFGKHSISLVPDIIVDNLIPDDDSAKILSKMPSRGDIVITKSAHDMSLRFIKRVIGLPGDKLEIINDVIHINDVAIKRVELGGVIFENNVKYIKFRETLPNGVTYNSYKLQYLPLISEEDYSNFGPYFIPDNHFFMMGDNRDESGDGRGQLGFIPSHFIIAKAHFVLLSTKDRLWDSKAGFIEQILRVGTWFKGIRFSRTFHGLYQENQENQ